MKKILVIDDDVQVQTTLQKILTREGYAVILAADGKQGLQHYQAQHIDLVITDLIMPEKDGIETIVALRRQVPDVKIIAISGGGRVDKKYHLTIAEQFGARKVLPKPIERQVLLQAVEDVLQS